MKETIFFISKTAIKITQNIFSFSLFSLQINPSEDMKNFLGQEFRKHVFLLTARGQRSNTGIKLYNSVYMCVTPLSDSFSWTYRSIETRHTQTPTLRTCVCVCVCVHLFVVSLTSRAALCLSERSCWNCYTVGTQSRIYFWTSRATQNTRYISTLASVY